MRRRGLAYHGMRYYAVWVGRWVAPDPLGLSNDGTNVYAYVRNNPMNYVDPFGLEGEKTKGEEGKGSFQWAKDKDENDLRHQRLIGLRQLLIDHGYRKSSITKLLDKFGDDQILGHYGYEEPGTFTHHEKFQEHVINAINRYEDEWLKNQGMGQKSIGPRSPAIDEAERKEEIL